jgi:uncharacterized protein (UPF0147 family)
VNCFLQFEEIGVDPNIKMYALIKVWSLMLTT